MITPAMLGGCDWFLASTPHPRPAAKAQTHCTRARIGPQVQCLAVGVRCNPRYDTAYGQYGFVCRRTADGIYRLRQHVFQGPPIP